MGKSQIHVNIQTLCTLATIWCAGSVWSVYTSGLWSALSIQVLMYKSTHVLHTQTHIVCACKRSRHHDCHISQPANLPDLWHWCIKIIVILKVSTSHLCVLQMSIYTLVWSRDVAMNTMYQIGLLYVCDIIAVRAIRHMTPEQSNQTSPYNIT